MSAPRLLVSDEAREVIVRESALYRDVETGGILMGRFESADAIHVTHASGPGPNAVHKPAFFLRDTAYCAGVLREHYERFGADYVGEWHTHVDGLSMPSPGDLLTLANIMHDPDYDFESFAMLLAVKFRRRRSRLELHAFVATKNLVVQSVVEELGTRKVEGWHMGEQSAARLEGDRYQHLYSWYELLRLLDEDSPYEYGYVEHPEAGAADDVTLHPKPGTSQPARYVQIKWHVDQRDAYSFASLTEVLSGSRSLLEKLFDSWKKLRASGPVEVWLVSNWQSALDLGCFIRSRGYTFSDEFLTAGGRTKAARCRQLWKKRLKATDEEIVNFCRDLRLRLGFSGISDFEEMVDERMARYGLRMGENARAIATDEVRAWIEVGGERKRITRDVLLEVIERRHLRAPKVDEPPVSLWVHGWGRRAFDRPPTVELDWTAHFDRALRRMPAQDVWDGELLPDLARARDELSAHAGGEYIDFRGKLPLTGVLAVGAAFTEVGGYKFRAEQPTRGENYLWRSDAKPSARGFVVTERDLDAGGEDILVTLSITGPALEDVKPLSEQLAGTLKAFIYAEPDNGTGDAAITGAEDAVALAVRAKELIRGSRNKYRAKRTHLVLYAPATYCLFLGQRLNALGEIVTYERTTEGGYQPSVILKTG